MRTSTRVMVSIFGALVGLIGIEHGLGEVLQGNVPPAGIMILSWPESAFFAILGGEPALTVLPNLLVTGLLAILFSLLYLGWSVLFVRRKRGGLILILLSIAMLLAGGGIFPPVFGVILGVAATRLHAPFNEGRLNLYPGRRHRLAKLWPWFLGACIIAWLGMFPGIALLSYFWGVHNTILIFALLVCMFGLLGLAYAAGNARDWESQAIQTAGTDHASEMIYPPLRYRLRTEKLRCAGSHSHRMPKKIG